MVPDADQWNEVNEVLDYQFGPWLLGKWRFAALSNRTNPIGQQDAPLNLSEVRRPLVYQQFRDDGSMSRRLVVDLNWIRYIAYKGRRHFINISDSSFVEYLQKFSGKTRNTLKRKLLRFARSSGGTIDVRYYVKAEEMNEFRDYAASISAISYQKRIGFGFPETDEFTRHLVDEARIGRVCGFILMHSDAPAAYVFCRVKEKIITYTLLGYDPKLAHLSPGTVLLVKIIEKCFEEQLFQIFDFGGQDWEYKEFFGTSWVDYIRIIQMPNTPKNFALIFLHYILQGAWRGAARLKGFLTSCRQGVAALTAWPSFRHIAGLTRGR